TNLRVTSQEIEGHVGFRGYSLQADGDVFAGLSSLGFFPVLTIVRVPPVDLAAGWSPAEFAFWVGLLLGGPAGGHPLHLDVGSLFVKCSLREIGLVLGERRVHVPPPAIQPLQRARLIPLAPNTVSSRPWDRVTLHEPLQAPEPAH